MSKMKKSLFYFLGIFSLFGCSPNIKMSHEELSSIVNSDPSTTLIINPGTGVILGYNHNTEGPPVPGLELFPTCHCYFQHECREEMPCVASYCINCEGINPNVPAKLICG